MPLDVSTTAHQIRSMVCRQAHFDAPWYRLWDERIGLSYGKFSLVPPVIFLHRKFWEWAAIAQCLYERGMLAAGRIGLGFAVGTEPLASLFSSFGVDILATDLSPEDPSAHAWQSTGQHAGALNALHFPHLVSRETFETRVQFQAADMRELAAFPKGAFDFVWSSCAMEHLGSLQAGIRFVLESSELLKPGGVGAHTTEFNVASLDHTMESQNNVIYLRKHIEALDGELRKRERCLAELDFFAGDGEHDRRFDLPPYYQAGRQHVKLQLDGHITTSITLIVLA
jgi:hypothetical protein